MNTKDIDLNLLVALDALLAERNVTKAAARLGISQPALSARLNRLRDVLGDPLLVPAQRGMIPTERALKLQEPLHTALEGVRSVVAEQSAFEPSTAEATISMAASDYVQLARLMPLSQHLADIAPGIRLAWRHLDGTTLYQQMEKGEVDLALITPETAPDQLRSRLLYNESYVIIERKKSDKKPHQMSLKQYCARDHVIVSPRGSGFSGPSDVALKALGYSRRVALSVPSFLIVPQLVAASNMIAAVPRRLVENNSDGLIVHEPPLDIAGFSIAMVWHDRSTTAPAHGWLREQLVLLETSRSV